MYGPPRISTLFPTTPLSRSDVPVAGLSRLGLPRLDTQRELVEAPQLEQTHERERSRRAANGCAERLTERTLVRDRPAVVRSEEHTSELQSRQYLVCRLLLEK